MRWLTNLYHFRFKSTATAAIGIHPTKACHCWWISKMQSDSLEERYAIELCFELGKNATKCMEWFTLLLEHFAWIEHQFLSGIRDSRKQESLWGMMKYVGGVRKSIHPELIGQRIRVRVKIEVLRVFRKRFQREEASTLQIGSVTFPSGQCTSPQLHPYHWPFDQDRHQDSFYLPYSPDLAPYDFWLFPKLRGCGYETIEEMKEAVTKVIDTLTQEDLHGAFQKLLERYNWCIGAGGAYFEGD